MSSELSSPLKGIPWSDARRKAQEMRECRPYFTFTMNTIVTEEKNDIDIRQQKRDVLLSAEKAISSMPGAVFGDSALCPLKHSFADGLYIREISVSKGTLGVSKIHKITHPYFVLKGDISVLTEEGVVRIKAPFSGITRAGTKRLVYAHEDTIWITVHRTTETDLKKIEEEIISKSFEEFDQCRIDNFLEYLQITENQNER